MTRALTVADAVARLQIQHRLASNPRVDAGHGAAAADAADIRLVAGAVALAWLDAQPGARGRAVLYGLFDSGRTIRLQKQLVALATAVEPSKTILRSIRLRIA